jgi:1,4-dihydroxy-2-naphthoate octaprenyltransferase
LIFATWFLQVTIFSNSHDASVDRRNSRWTVAALTGETANRWFLATVFVLGWAFVAISLGAGWAPIALVAAVAAVMPMQIGQVWHGVVHARYLNARRLGFWVIRLGLPTVFVTNLWSHWR